MHQKKSIFVLIILFLLTTNCQKDESIYLEPTRDIVLFPNVKVIDDNDFSNLVASIDSTDYTIHGHSNLLNEYELSAGDIFVSGVGYGLLRKIDSTSTQDNITRLYTSQATFDDAIEEGYFFHQSALTTQMIDSVEYLYEGVKLMSDATKDDDEFKFDIDIDLGYSVRLKGELTMKNDIVFELDISRLLRLRKVQYGFESTTNAEIELSAGGSFNFNPSLQIFTLHFTPIVIPTVIPIVITPRLDVYVGLDGSAEASVSTSVHGEFNYQVGVLFERGDGWSTYNTPSYDWDFNPPQATLEASATAYVQPEIGLMLYGVIGAYMDARVYSEIAVTPLSLPLWELFIGYRVGIGARATILGFELFDVNYPELLADKWLLADSGSDPPDATTGSLSGTVRDALTSQGLANVNVKAYLGNSLVDQTQTDGSGGFFIDLPANPNYRIEFTKQGYVDVNYHNVVVEENQTHYLEPVLQVDNSYGGNGNISGTIQDAFDGQGIPDAQIQIREGMNAQQGNVIATVTSDNSGNYVITNIPGGNYTIEVSKAGYYTSFVSVVCVGGQTTPNQNVSLSPSIADHEIRIILDWGANPLDLDAHLTGPIPQSTNRFHIFYHEQSFYYNNILYAALDHDVADGYGPETITIYQQTAGTYRYSVHDHSNMFSDTSSELSASNARVRVYYGDQLINTFNVPGNTPGTLWTVFELDGQDITPINEMTFENNPGSITKENDIHLIRNLPAKR